MKVEVTRYRKPDGYPSRYWAVLIDGELLAVTVYRKGAEAVARAITNPNTDPHVTILQDTTDTGTMPDNASPGVAPYRTR